MILLSVLIGLVIGGVIAIVINTFISPPSPTAQNLGGGTDHSGAVASNGAPHDSTSTHEHHADEESHPHSSGGWKELGQKIFGWLVVGAVAVAVVALSSNYIVGCQKEMRQTREAKERRDANPDNYWWDLWECSDHWSRVAYGISRETSPSDGRVIMKWRSDTLNGDITASCIPGKEGSWEAINGYGQTIKRFFSVTSVSDSEVAGSLDKKHHDDVIRRTPFKFVRSSKK